MLGANCDNRYMSPYGLIDGRLAPNIGLEDVEHWISNPMVASGKSKPAQAGQSVKADEDDV
jgi:hypothetical protein